MTDLISKAVYASVGLAYMTKEKVQEVGKKVVADAKVSEAEGKKFLEELQKKADEARASTMEMVNKQVSTVLKSMDIPTRKEIDALKKRIAKLEETLDKKA
ncbi:MAG: hypothetical protein GF331_16640 [Chitinivibrionales bacterium]|nr:hypothetical protein [Chitinivibrionales bacterium]